MNRESLHIVRYADRTDGTPHVGIRVSNGVAPLEVDSMSALLSMSLSDIRGLVEATNESLVPADALIALPPADGLMEVWAAGVTYSRSKEARVEESSQSDVYDKVYKAERPELFFKALPWRVVTDGEPIAIRRDSTLNVPEPELAIVVNAGCEIVGYTICNDVSSRIIESENPLYLPQAKMYAGSCALASGVRPSWDVNLADLTISMLIERNGKSIWEGSSSTSYLRRSPQELVDYIFREEQFPHGVIISTGTGIVPELSFSLSAGDIVSIAIAEIGVLRNPVVDGKPSMAWLTEAVTDARIRLIS